MDFLSLLFASFALGLARGSSTCVLVCAPGMIPYIVEKKSSITTGLKYGLIFNIPRILLLTALGAFVGYLGFEIGRFRGLISGLGFLGYILIGLLLLFLGIYSLRESLYPEKKGGLKLKKHFLWRWRLKISRKTRLSEGNLLFLVWGSLLSIACLGEIAIIEAAFLGGAAGGLENSPLAASGFGALAMFIFAWGAAIPVIAVTTLSSYASKKITKDVAQSVKTIGAMLMILVALFIIGSETYLLLRS